MFGKKKKRKEQTGQSQFTGQGEAVENEVVLPDKPKKKRLTRWKFRRFLVAVCWLLYIAGFGWSIYRNYTVVDRVTVKETERIEEKVRNTSGIENFVKNFASLYYTYSVDPEVQIGQTERLKGYMPEEMVNTIPVNYMENDVSVSGVQIWDVQNTGDQKYTVKFSVIQKMQETSVQKTYLVDVYADDTGYTILGLPRVSSMPGKSGYTEPVMEQSVQVNADTRQTVEEFLNTFFAVYPKATQEELKYYFVESDVKVIQENLLLVSVDNVIIAENEDQSQAVVSCMVTYRDEATGFNEAGEYTLTLAKQGDNKYMISGME